MSRGLLPGVRVLELGAQISTSYCGKILALMGAEVVKVEPPEGDAARRAGPFPGDLPHPEKSGLFLALNLNKYGITLDLTLAKDRQQLRDLARTADVVIQDLPHGETLRRDNPGLILTAISPFGSWGPYARFKASDLVLFHMSGQAPGMLGPVADGGAKPPIRAGGHQAEFVAGLAAATATLMALYRQRKTGAGCCVEVSAFEAMVTQLISALANCAFDKPPAPRVVPDSTASEAAAPVASVGGVLPCRDGYVAISPREDAQWARWVELMGHPTWADEPRFQTREGRERHFPELWELVGQWTRAHAKHDVARWGQERRIPCFPANTVRDLFNDAHLKAREFFCEIEHPVAGRLAYPGVPYRFSHLTLPLTARPAPRLGEHNERFLEQSPAPLPVSGSAGFQPAKRNPAGKACPGPRIRYGAGSDPGMPALPGRHPPDRLPLHGVRVVDLSWIIAGPTAARFLAMMGAEVIKVGSARRPDPSIRGAPFQAYNQSKRSCALNIATPAGLNLARQLIALSDVVIENFAAGVIERLGLGYDMLRALKPDLIMVSSSGTGHSGPDKDYVAYGSLLQYYTGWNSISGYPDGEPIKGGLWADPWVGLELAMVTAAALNHRAVTGEGQYVDYSMAEALTACLPEALLDFQMNARERRPMGNADDQYAPHNVYRCKGPDRWIAIAVTDEAEWQALCGVIERPDLAAAPDLASAAGRRACQGDVDAAITAWTKQQDDYEAMHRLQQAGVPAGPFLEPSRLFHDSHLRQGGYFTRLQTHDGTWRDLPGIGWRFDGGPAPDVAPAPVLGQDDDYVYRDILGLSGAEIARLVEEQIIY